MEVYDFYITPEEYDQAERIGISNKRLEQRIRDEAWSKKDALSTPVGTYEDRKHYAKIAEQNGIKYQTFIQRVIVYGWTMERAATQELQDRRVPQQISLERRRRFDPEMVALAESNGIKYMTFRSRVLNKGMSEEKAATMPLVDPSEKGRITKQILRKRYGDKNKLIFGGFANERN